MRIKNFKIFALFFELQNFYLRISIELTVKFNDSPMLSKFAFEVDRNKNVMQAIVQSFCYSKDNLKIWKYRDCQLYCSFKPPNENSSMTYISPTLTFNSPSFSKHQHVLLFCDFVGQGHIEQRQNKRVFYHPNVLNPTRNLDPLAVKIPYKSPLKKRALAHFLNIAKKNGSFFHQSDFVCHGNSSTAQRNCNGIVELFTATPSFQAKFPNPPKILELNGQFLPKNSKWAPTQPVCYDIYEKLESLLSHCWVQSEEWSWLFDSLQSWKFAIFQFLQLLFRHTEKQQKIHERKGANMANGLTYFRRALPSDTRLKPNSRTLCEKIALQTKSVYEPVLVQDFLIKSNHRVRDIKNLQFHCQVAIFIISLGGRNPTYFYIWKTDPNLLPEQNYQKCEQISARCRSEIHQSLSRAEKRILLEHTSSLTPFDQKLVLLGHDIAQGTTSLTKSQRASLDYLLHTGDYESIKADFIAVLEKPTKFDAFWESLGAVIGDFTAEAERRRRTSQGYVPMCHSVPHLIRLVCQHRETKTGTPFLKEQIPHAETVRRSFEPVRMTNANNHFSGRFPIRSIMQKRDLRAHNDDSYYCNKLWKNWKIFESEWSSDLIDENSDVKNISLSVDDKSTVVIGEKEFLQPQTRQKPVYTPSNLYTRASDHDTDASLMKLVFSMTQQVHPDPDNPTHLRHGDVAYCLHDNITAQSSPRFHFLNLKDYIEKVQKSPKIGLLLIFSDGGHDHNPSFPTVRFYDLILFLMLQPDAFSHLRCAGGQSAVNPVEITMAVVNIALNGHSNRRFELFTPHFESFFRGVSSIKELRGRVKNQQKFHDEVRSSAEKTCTEIHKSMGFLRHHNRPFFKLPVPQVYHNQNENTQENTPRFSEKIDNILEKFGLLNANSLDIKSANPELKKFLSTHCVFSPYATTFWKCGDESCEFCDSINSPKPIFDRFHSIKSVNPVRIRGANERYFDFKTTCVHPLRSEPNLPPKKSNFKQPFSFTHSNICGYVQCNRCKLYRCIFKNPDCQLSTEDFLRDLDESIFTCMSIIHQSDLFVVDRRLVCEKPIHVRFYSKFCNPRKSTSFPTMRPPCRCCGTTLSNENTVAYTTQLAKFQNVQPTCQPIDKPCTLATMVNWIHAKPRTTGGKDFLQKQKRGRIQLRKKIISAQNSKTSKHLTHASLFIPAISAVSLKK